MRDIDIINKAVEDAQAVLRDYIQPGPRDLLDTLARVLEILDHEEVVAAQSACGRAMGA